MAASLVEMVASDVTGALTSQTALGAYAGVLAGGVVIGVAVKLGPRLFRHFWKYVPAEPDTGFRIVEVDGHREWQFGTDGYRQYTGWEERRGGK